MQLTPQITAYEKFYANADLREYAGEWVAIINEKVVAHNKSVKSLMLVIKEKYSGKVPFVVKVPAREIVLW